MRLVLLFMLVICSSFVLGFNVESIYPVNNSELLITNYNNSIVINVTDTTGNTTCDINSTGWASSQEPDPLYCYQETANESTYCGGNDTGRYFLNRGDWANSSNNVVDGDYTTSETYNVTDAAVIIRYKKISNVSNISSDYYLTGAVWQVKSALTIENITIPNVCWNAEADKIRLRFQTEGTPEQTEYLCYNGSSWYRIHKHAAAGAHYFYEEGLFWRYDKHYNTSSTLTNSSNLASGQYTFNYTCTNIYQSKSNIISFKLTGLSLDTNLLYPVNNSLFNTGYNSSIVIQVNNTRGDTTCIITNSTGWNTTITVPTNSSFTCYQETANESTYCGGFDNGTYSFAGRWTNDGDGAIDGDYTTSDRGNISSATVNITYYKPQTSNITGSNLTGATAQLKYEAVPTSILNVTVPNSCFNTYENRLMMQVISSHPADNIFMYCRNTTGWQLIAERNVVVHVFEEAIFWQYDNINYYNTSITLTNGSSLAEQDYYFEYNCSNPYEWRSGHFNFAYNENTEPPNVSVNYSFVSGFNQTTINVSMLCFDQEKTNLTYNLTFNGNTLIYDNYTNNSLLTNITPFVNGENILYGWCYDGTHTTNVSLEFEIYHKQLALIDEKTNTAFDVNNISSAKVFFDDNSSVHDFQEAGGSTVNYTSLSTDKLRFELTYADGAVITRYIDISVLNQSVTRVCANKEGITHYPQDIISAREKKAIIRSVFANCYIVADYTRFAYQAGYFLRAYSINTMYYLSMEIDGVTIYVSSIDGSVSSNINLDHLDFEQTKYNFNILDDSLTFQKTNDTDIISIYYRNIANDNNKIDIVITRLDTDVELLSITETDTPNEWTILFDKSTLVNVTNSTIFKIELTRYKESGTDTIKKYFNFAANSYFMTAPLAFVISVLITLFGLTFTIARLTFSYFGIMIQIIAMAIIATAPLTWYLLFLLGMDVIILAFIGILMFKQNYAQVA